VEDWRYRLIAGIGFVTIAWLAWVTGKRKRPNWRTIGGSAALAWGLGIVSFWFPGSRWLWSMINDLVVAVLTASQKGTLFLLGPPSHLVLARRCRMGRSRSGLSWRRKHCRQSCSLPP